jgi:hypothetical protein
MASGALEFVCGHTALDRFFLISFEEDVMNRALSHRIKLWYRLARRRMRHLRRMCISLLTIALAIAKVIDAVMKLYSSSTL